MRPFQKVTKRLTIGAARCRCETGEQLCGVSTEESETGQNFFVPASFCAMMRLIDDTKPYALVRERIKPSITASALDGSGTDLSVQARLVGCLQASGIGGGGNKLYLINGLRE